MFLDYKSVYERKNSDSGNPIGVCFGCENICFMKCTGTCSVMCSETCKVNSTRL